MIIARTERYARFATLAATLASGCGDDPQSIVPPVNELIVVEVATGLAQPVHLAAPPDDDRLFVVERPGRIRIIDDGELLSAPFLDITANVETSYAEQGLLSVAFHPDYAANGQFFVNYTEKGGDTRIERYSVSADPDLADPGSARLILSVHQPQNNHNGGLVMFGPDGMLYIGMGDGAGVGDPMGNGQDGRALLGALLRIDVDGGEPYAIPADNPFADGVDGRPEIWAIGLRNPWRFSFDTESELIWIADVGQDVREEINAEPASQGGLNYGWNILEGSDCYASSSCSRSDLVLPVLDYDHGSQGCSVTGGFVYRGEALSGLQGHYFYGDFCITGVIRSLRLTPSGSADVREWPLDEIGNVTSFGEDAAGELYVADYQGRVYRLAAP